VLKKLCRHFHGSTFPNLHSHFQWIGDVYPGLESGILEKHIPDPGVKKAPDPEHSVFFNLVFEKNPQDRIAPTIHDLDIL
jgi:hypothetical protein